MSGKLTPPFSDMLDPESRPPVPDGLGRRALSGVAWNYTAAVITAVGQIAYTAIMARLVSPEAFGLLAMTVAARGLVASLSRMGIGPALIQKPSLSDEEKRAGLTLGVAFGVCFFGLFWILAPELAELFKEPRAVPVMRGAAVVFVMAGFRATPENLLRRDLRYKEVALINLVGFLFGNFVVGVGAALAGAGVWALVFAQPAQGFIITILCYERVRHPVRPTLNLNSYRALLSFGSRFSLVGLVGYLGSETDTVIVGRYAGTNLLGAYNRAFYLAVLPLQIIMNTMHEILFSSFSRIQSDPQRLKRAYLNSVKLSAAIFIPVSAGLGAASQEIIVVILGERYRVAAAVVPFLAVYAAMTKMSNLSGVVCDARASFNSRLILQAAYSVGLVGGLLAVAGGPLWAYGAVLAGAAIVRNLAYNVLIIRKVIPVELSELFKPYVPGLTAAAVVILAVVLTRAIVVDALVLSPLIALMAEAIVAAIVFFLLVRRGSLSFLRKEILSRMSVHPAGAGRNRFLAFVLRFLLGPSPKPRV
jgi:lipopolysaccharide exporter